VTSARLISINELFIFGGLANNQSAHPPSPGVLFILPLPLPLSLSLHLTVFFPRANSKMATLQPRWSSLWNLKRWARILKKSPPTAPTHGLINSDGLTNFPLEKKIKNTFRSLLNPRGPTATNAHSLCLLRVRLRLLLYAAVSPTPSPSPLDKP